MCVCVLIILFNHYLINIGVLPSAMKVVFLLLRVCLCDQDNSTPNITDRLHQIFMVSRL